MKNAVVFFTHILSSSILERYQKLVNDLKGAYDVCLVLSLKSDQNISQVTSEHAPLIQTYKVYHLTSNTLPQTLGYPFSYSSIIPGYTHLGMIEFMLSHKYDHYYFVENDVLFTGNWMDLLTFIDQHEIDFIPTVYKRYLDSDLGWHWWKALSHPTKKVSRWKKRLSFNPFYRISQAALSHLHQAHKDGWSGHFEVLIPTLLSLNGFSIATVNTLARKAHVNPFYSNGRASKLFGKENHSGTFRWRPLISPKEISKSPYSPCLFHPVKPTDV